MNDFLPFFIELVSPESIPLTGDGLLSAALPVLWGASPLLAGMLCIGRLTAASRAFRGAQAASRRTKP